MFAEEHQSIIGAHLSSISDISEDRWTQGEETVMSQLTWYFEVEVTGAAHSGDGGSLTFPGDALLHPAVSKHLHCERTSCSDTNIKTLQKRCTCNRILYHCSITTIVHYRKVILQSVCTWNMLVSKLDVDDVISWFSWTVGDFTRPILHVFTVNVHFTGTLDGQTQTSIT